jgi:hypothetical protein
LVGKEPRNFEGLLALAAGSPVVDPRFADEGADQRVDFARDQSHSLGQRGQVP